MAVAHARGWFELDAPVADHWPAFATNGKQDITVRQLLAHQAGLVAPDRRVDLALAADHDRLGALLAGARPAWEPGTRHGYHGVTLGWYESQLLSRVDPRGRTLGTFFADGVATPLGAAFHIGLPDEVTDDAVATFHAFSPPEMLLHLGAMPRTVLMGMLNPGSMVMRMMRALPVVVDPDALNRRKTLRVEVPAFNGIGQPRAMARIYGAFASGGAELKITPGTLHELTGPAVTPSGGPRDVVLGIDGAYAMGLLRPISGMRFGSSDRSFGAPGGGGSLGFADPDARIGYAYAMNRMGFHMPVDPRELALRRAFYTAIGGRPQS